MLASSEAHRRWSYNKDALHSSHSGEAMTAKDQAIARYLISTEVANAGGSQIWFVDATSEAEALALHNNGKSEFHSDEVEVTALHEPEIIGTTTLDDFGDDKPAPDCRTCVWVNACRLDIGTDCTDGDQYKAAPKVVLWRTE